jgi:NitT/TauT family transport system permease protein
MSVPAHLHKGKHYRHHHGVAYPISLPQRLYTSFLAPLLFIFVLISVMALYSEHARDLHQTPSILYLCSALGATFVRLLVAYVFAVLFAIPLAFVVARSVVAERILLPIFDIVQSVPVLAFFPVVIVLFTHFGFYNGAAIFIIFLNMLWNIVFNMISGLKAIPNDIVSAASIFNIKGLSFLLRILLPASVPSIITGSLLAWAEGWNIIVIAEVLHVYIPNGSSANDLFGIGSVLVNASSGGDTTLFISAIVTMVLAIGFLNFFLWQKLLHYAERFKFE